VLVQSEDEDIMMSAEVKGITPRVNGSMLNAHNGRVVLLVGQVLSSDPSAATRLVGVLFA
jgi:Replication factor A protein 3